MRKLSFIKKLSLAFKIGGGFSIVILLLLAVSFMSWKGLSKVKNTLEDYNILSERTNLSDEFLTDMLKVQMNVKDYIISGEKSSIDQYEQYAKKMKEFLLTIKDPAESKGNGDLASVSSSLEGYRGAFSQITELKEDRKKIVNNLMSELGPEIVNNLTEIMITANNEGDAVAAFLAGMSLKSLMSSQIASLNFLESNAKKDSDAALAQYNEYLTSAHRMDILLSGEIQIERNKKVQVLAGEYIQSFSDLVQLIDTRNYIVNGGMASAGEKIATSVQLYKNNVKEQRNTLGQSLQAITLTVNKIIVGISLIALTIGSITALFLTRAITKPVKETSRFAEKMAKGDFSQLLEVKVQDEIGLMSKSLNTMVAELGSVIDGIIIGIKTLSNSSGELKKISNHLTESAAATSEQSHGVATSAQDLSGNINAISASMEEATSNTNIVAAAAEEMNVSVNEISSSTASLVNVSSEAVRKSERTSKNMVSLGEAAAAVDKVTKVITEISDQTNLLALNATIEAARAGSAGKGFTVVATEIKELAKQTAEATVDIRGQISNMQETTVATVSDMQEMSKLINQINEIILNINLSVEEQAKATSEISGTIAKTSLSVAEINQNLTQSSHSATSITEDISDVDRTSATIASSSMKVQKDAENLANLSNSLNDMVAKFVVRAN